MRRFLGGLGWAACLVLAMPAVGRAQQKFEEVQFSTVDGVELHGKFYASSKGNSPCVMLLHKLGEDSSKQGWEDLADKLSQGGYAVLAFDFRGHGGSTKIAFPQKFWSLTNNLGNIKGASVTKDKLAFRDFHKQYTPVLVNDIAAAKKFLDQQSDAHVCNSSNIIVIGAEEGAALGALWINYEWKTIHRIPHPFYPNRPILDPQGKREGEDIAGAVWLSIPQDLNGVPMGYLLKGQNPFNVVRNKVPMAFFFGEEDQKAAKAAHKIFDELKKAEKTTLEWTGLNGKKTKLSGIELVGKKELKTEDEILNYLDKDMQRRGKRPPTPHDKDWPLDLIPLSSYAFGLR